MKYSDRHYSAMTIRDGKFYKGEKPVPLEFGNWEQIVLMDRALKKYNALKKDGLEADVSFSKDITGHVYFYCVCGQSIAKSSDVDEEGDLEPLEGFVQCPKCRKGYEVFEENNKLFVKFRSK